MVIFFLFISCRKNELNPNEQNQQCIPFPPEYYNHVGWITTQTELPRQLRPCFNPNNSNEILYQEDTNEGTGIYKYNLLTKEKTLIVEESIVSQPSWGLNNWILLVFYDFNVWRVRPDGTELEQLTSEGGYYSPKWNVTGERFMTYTPGQQGYSYIHEANGVVIDSIPFNVRNSYTWQKPDHIISHFENIYKLYEISSNAVIAEYEHTLSSGAGSVFWVGSEKIIYSNPNGIYTSNSLYQNISKLVDACDSRSYGIGDINHEKTLMIWTTSNKEYIGGGVVKVNTKLQLMDMNGNVIIEDIAAE